MKKHALLAILVLGSPACGPDKEVVAKADLPREPGADSTPLPPTQSAASLVWQKSTAAEAGGDFEHALSALTQLPAPEHDGYLATYRRGWLLYRLGRYADSVAAYNQATALEPAGIEARLASQVPLISLHKWNDVAAISQEILSRDPENYLALQRLGFAKFSTQHYPEAELSYRRLVQHYPGDVDVRASLGWTLLRMGKQKEAAELFSQVLEISANHVAAATGYREAAAHRKGKH